jgi:Polysaccharide lyase
MKSKKTLGILIGFFLLCGLANADIIFTDSGGSSYSSAGWKLAEGTVTNAKDPLGSATVYHMIKAPNQKRGEMCFYGGEGKGYLNYEKDYWFKYSFLLPSSWTLPPAGPDGQWCTIGQWHVYPDICDVSGCSSSSCQWSKVNGEPWTNFLKQGTGGQYYFRMPVTYQTATCDTSRPWFNGAYGESALFSKGSWHTLIFNVRFSYSGTGYNKAWLDGKQFMNSTGANNAFNDDHPPYFCLGIYCGANGAQTEVYIKDITVGLNSSYAEISGQKPGTLGKLLPPEINVVYGEN